MAAALLQEISKDERERAVLRSRRMAETDHTSNILTAEKKGRIEGRVEGIIEGEKNNNLQIAQKLLAEGSTPEFIKKITGLDIENIS